MIKDKVDEYFKKKGINVWFNTLGHNDLLIRSFIRDTQELVDSTPEQTSHHVKSKIYNSMFDFEDRPKYTGFEKLRKLDVGFRKKIAPKVTEAQFSPLLTVERSEHDYIDLTYKEALVQTLKEVKNPLLYLSGGIDSEFVAHIMVTNNIDFIPVIFEWTDNDGDVLNTYDTSYAFEFCRKNNITPVVKKLNLENLWQSEDFYAHAVDVQIVSTHLNTYTWLVKLLHNEYPDVTHLFGGEIRYYSNHKMPDESLANVAFLAKFTPGYNGGTLNTGGPVPGNGAFVTLYNYNPSAGSYTGGYGLFSYTGGAGFGYWTNNTFGSYEVNSNIISSSNNQGYVNIQFGTGGSWVGAFANSGQAFTFTNGANGSGYYYCSYRLAGAGSPVVTAYLTLSVTT